MNYTIFEAAIDASYAAYVAILTFLSALYNAWKGPNA